jgi:signal peptidase I
MDLKGSTTELTRDYPVQRRSETLEGIVNTLDWLLVAIILALLFRAFALEAFQIPTGSMAETLSGDHWRLRCFRCGYAYNLGADSGFSTPRCPSCGYPQPKQATEPMARGDRIFVNKSIYQFSEPRRWDVVIFKNPTNPLETYIKRLIGLPGEKVELIDGDVYINGEVVRKPRKVQEELWMCLYDNDYQPMEARARHDADDDRQQELDEHPWKSPFANAEGSAWDLEADGPTVFRLDSPPDQTHTIQYVPRSDDEFRAMYAYNSRYLNIRQPYCSDLMIRFWTQTRSEQGVISAVFRKQGVRWFGRVDFYGQLTVGILGEDGQVLSDRRMAVGYGDMRRGAWFEFGIADRRAVLRYGPYRLSMDMGPLDNDLRVRRQKPEVSIMGGGNLTLRHIALYRDTYYMGEGMLRAEEGEPFHLNDDEFFVCGDNSPNSADSRLWEEEGTGNNGRRYRMGTVPREYMLGKAFFVYWSDAFRPTSTMMPILPNLDGLRLICGSSQELY